MYNYTFIHPDTYLFVLTSHHSHSIILVYIQYIYDQWIHGDLFAKGAHSASSQLYITGPTGHPTHTLRDCIRIDYNIHEGYILFLQRRENLWWS